MKTSVWAVAVLLLSACAGSLRADAPLPRAHYTPGEVLEYEGRCVSKYQSGQFIYTTKEKMWVVAQRPDGSWVMLVRGETRDHRDDSRLNEPDRTHIGWMRTMMYSDGHSTETVATDSEMGMQDVGRSVPADAQEMKSGWESKSGDFDSHFSVVPGGAPGQIVIHDVLTAPEDVVYLTTRTIDRTYDIARGLRVRDVEYDTQGYGFVGETTGTTTLVSTGTETPARIKQLSDEFDAYMAAKKSTEDWITPDSTPDQIDVGAVAFTAAMTKARAAAPDFADVIDKDLAGMKQSLDYEKKGAQARMDLLHAPAADWKTTDLKGAPHALADYRGQVVVLDFWYRGCGWCMMAMPQVIDAAAHFAGQPVTFLAMTTDAPKSKDADFVVDKMKIPYPALYAKEIAQSYKITGFPTLLVLDPKGVVRFVHVGYAKDLREQIETNVESLLKEKK